MDVKMKRLTVVDVAGYGTRRRFDNGASTSTTTALSLRETSSRRPFVDFD